MSTLNMTRRRFLKGSAGTCAAVVAAGAVYESGVIPAFAKAGIGEIPQTDQIYTICEGCPNNCGCIAYNVNGQMKQIMPDYGSTSGAGALCARGYSYTQSALPNGNITKPLKRLPSGRYDELDWDAALAEIAETLNAVSTESGAGALACIYSPSSTLSFFAPRLMNSLGSGNVYVDDVVYNASKAAGFIQAIGVDSYTPDFANAKLAILIDTSYADVERPDMVKALQAARESGTPIVAVDSRLGTVGAMADQWISVKPGTELALILAVCNELVVTNRYDSAYVNANSEGFGEWAKAILPYNAEWAAETCGITSTEVQNLASAIAGAAPSVAIEYGNGTIATGTYANSGETARAVCLLNTIIGAWNQAGGALLPFDWTGLTAADSAPQLNIPYEGLQTVFDTDAFPLATESAGSMAVAVERIKTHSIKALIAADANIAADYASVEGFDEALRELELFVAITREMNETALLADYVLPECSYLEAAGLPRLYDGASAAVGMRTQAIEPANPDARAAQDILCGIGLACGSLDDALADIENISQQQLRKLGQTIDSMRTAGTATLQADIAKRISQWMTPANAVQFTSTACQEAGVAECPVWTEPFDANDAIESEGGVSLRLITGQQTAVGPDSANIARIMDIAKQYALQSAWINPAVADLLGVETGSQIVVSGKRGSDVVTCKVTERINPDAIYMPRFFGSTSPELDEANGVGVNPMIFTDATPEAGYGALCNLGACVSIQKAGA